MKEEPAEPTFWLTWIVGLMNGTERHMTFEIARQRAIELAKAQGCVVYVLKCVGAAVPDAPPVRWTDMKKEEEKK